MTTTFNCKKQNKKKTRQKINCSVVIEVASHIYKPCIRQLSFNRSSSVVIQHTRIKIYVQGSSNWHTTTTNINFFPRDARVVALPLYIGNKTAEYVACHCQVQSYHMLVLSEIVEHVNELKVTFTLLTNKRETLLAFSRVWF